MTQENNKLVRKGRRVLQFMVQNRQRIQLAVINTAGVAVVEVGGKNAAGKSSLIGSLFSALYGKRYLPPSPIRDGEVEGASTVDFGDLKIVERLVRKDEGGFSRFLTVTLNGEKVKGEVQEYLESMISKLAGVKPPDPSDFVALSKTAEGKREQERMLLKACAGYDLAKAEKRAAEIEDERRLLGRQVRALAGALEKTPADVLEPGAVEPPDVVALERVVTEERKKKEALTATEYLSTSRKREAEIAEEAAATAAEDVDLAKARLAEMEEVLQRQRDLIVTRETAAVEALEKAKEARVALIKVNGYLASMPRADVETAEKAWKDALALGREAEARQARRVEYDARKKELADMEEQYEGLNGLLKRLADEKVKALQRAKLPVEGLTFGPAGMMFRGVPFEQAAESEQYKVALVVAFSMIPDDGFRIVPMREYNALDADSRAEVEKFVDKLDGQVWAQRIMDEPDGKALFIEEGMLVSTPGTGKE